jgi:2,6-dihydroxypyridine 3-monooxygenase
LTLQVAVVGGSIGGLTAANLLREAGCDVDVYERSASMLEGRGVGIVVHPMTVRFLLERRLETLDELSVTARCLRYLDSDGSVVYEEQDEYRFTAWNALYRALRGSLEDGRCHLGEALVSLEPRGKRVGASFASGRQVECDLLVCADGVSSTARARLLHGAAPVYAGYVAWRGILDESRLTPVLRDELGSTLSYHVMPRGHILVYPIPAADGSTARGRRLLNFVWYRNVEAGSDLKALLTDSAGVEHDLSMPPGAARGRFLAELRTAAGRLPPQLREVVRRVALPFVQKVVDVEVPRMLFGRVCLLGDAAFTARPHAAAGTAKAAADAWRLFESVSSAGADLDAALLDWERSQLELGRQLVARSRRIGERSQFEGSYHPQDAALRFGLRGPGD